MALQGGPYIPLSEEEKSHMIGISKWGTPIYPPSPMRKFEDAVKYVTDERGREVPVFKCRKCDRWKYHTSFHPPDLAIRRKGICYSCGKRSKKHAFKPRFKMMDNQKPSELRLFCKVHGEYLLASEFRESFRNTRRALCMEHSAMDARLSKEYREGFQNRRNIRSKNTQVKTFYCSMCALPSKSRVCPACKYGAPAIAMAALARDPNVPRGAVDASEPIFSPALLAASGVSGNQDDNACAWFALSATCKAGKSRRKASAIPSSPYMEDVSLWMSV
jgi:hypothetical protein